MRSTINSKPPLTGTPGTPPASELSSGSLYDGPPRMSVPRTPTLALTAVVLMLGPGLSACGGSHAEPGAKSTSATNTKTATTRSSTLPGTGRPQITIGDKNFTEQFVLGELYSQALEAQGYTVMVNRNIGPSDVTFQALESKRLDMYPEYLSTWDSSIAGYRRSFHGIKQAYLAGQHYALAHGLELLDPTPASSTGAIGVTNAYAYDHDLKSLGDLRRVAPEMTLGAPPQFETSATGLPLLQQVYGFTPATFKALDVGAQYQALDQGTVQAANVGTTDGQLATGRYTLLRDPRHTFGWGKIVPVVAARVLTVEGPVFTKTVDRVSALLSTNTLRHLNAAVDIGNQDPKLVAKQFLQQHGLVPVGGTP
jgi:osmoprotectant transport system substrate-binding protein